MDSRKRVPDYRGNSSPKRSRHEDEFSHRGRSPPRVPEYVTRVLVPAPQLARIIGRGGQHINTVRQTCGVRVETSDLSGDERMVTLSGSLRGINDGFGMIVRCLEESAHEFEPFRITALVPTDKAGLVVGARGAVVKEIKAKTGVDDLMVGHRDEVRRFDDAHGTKELRVCHLIGPPRAVVKAHALMSEKVYGVTEEYDERQREQRSDRREVEVHAPRVPEVMAPPPSRHSRESENDRVLEAHRVPALIAREVEQLQQAIAPYGLEIQLVPVARRRDDSRERSFSRASFDSRDVRYDSYHAMEPPRDRIRERSPFRGDPRDPRDHDFSPGFRHDGGRSATRAPPPVRREEVEACFSIPADKAGAVIGKHGVGCRKIENDFRVKISISTDSTQGERSVIIKGAELDTQAARARIEQIIESTPDRPAPRDRRNDSTPTQSTPQRDSQFSDLPSSVEGGYGYSLDPYGSSITAEYGGSYGDGLSYSTGDHGAAAAPQGAAAYGQWDADVGASASQAGEPRSQT